MAAKYILAMLSVGFLIASVAKLARIGGELNPQIRTWLLIAVLFGAVSIWLFTR